MKSPVFAGLLALACVLPSLAQQPTPQPAEEKAKAPAGRQVRFLPVGDLPPFRQEIRDGVAYELEPPAGSIPPRQVAVGFGEEKTDAVPLLLGRVTEPLAAPGGEGPMLIRQGNDAADAEPWLRVNRPETGDFLVLLWRDATKGDWGKARSLVLSDAPEAAPAGRVRIVNISPVAVGVVFGGERIKLEAGKSYQRAMPIGKDTEFQLGAVTTSGDLQRFHSGSIFQNPGERSLIVIYRADGVQPRRPLKAVVHREPVK
ncbi:hypothetical protein OKA04_07410 [Luteolibacter flavescens]|uniref:Uncharacterized protein n=1 Tax=Luteolibacter flavescens TaxID=1859460 RepID=A0ABT3FLV1_9BACT|nr:hypothetical protein [Luteolibacter flavescens]MCW1884555.1 hypothetical protein [Luteolibacter flavescens]